MERDFSYKKINAQHTRTQNVKALTKNTEAHFVELKIAKEKHEVA